MSTPRTWISHGLLNTLEHALTRGADAATTLVLLWAFAPETFSQLALAQAIVAPTLLFFVSIEAVIYREYARWKAEGPSVLAARLHALRLFAWGKAQCALLFSLGLAFALPESSPWLTRVLAVIWAYALVLTPQISGADREFLRIDLKLRALNLITLYQKVILLGGTVVVSVIFPESIALLAAVAVFSAVSTGFLTQLLTKRTLRELGASPASIQGREGPSTLATLTEALTSFSAWFHLIGVVTNWVATMDLFFLGLFRLPARELGLYSAALKLANFSAALPTALTNTFQIWIGRRAESEGQQRETYLLKRYSSLLAAGSILQAIFIYVLAPFLFQILSRGRWSAEEQARMLTWLGWILAGGAGLSSTLLLTAWLLVRRNTVQFLLKVYVPWLVIALGIYSYAAYSGGPDGAAKANLAVVAAFLPLVLHFARRR